MKCAWKPLMSILPKWMVQNEDRFFPDKLLELRLRRGSAPQLVLPGGCRQLPGTVSQEDLSYCVNCASKYSPWAASTIAQGYLTIEGGHRIGICGDVICKEGTLTGVRQISSLCIRVARDVENLCNGIRGIGGSILILGAPGWGKTTLLRDLSRTIGMQRQICVVDERGELFPDSFARSQRMDILTGAPKAQGIEMVLRTMGPEYIALDEITAPEDCQAVLQAHGCGVNLLATAHGRTLEDLKRRQVYRPLVEHNVFQSVLVLHSDWSFRTERIHTWSTDGLALR